MEQRNYRLLLSQKQFLKLMLANLVSRFGDSLDVIAYSWIMYEVTGSESLMALTDVARFVIVAVFVTLYANGALTPLRLLFRLW